MDADQIKDILEAYLRAKFKDVRIFREKSIGASICDIMAVTDMLIGFEIKSNLDNYERLPRQVKAYDLFFDKNYIVVGISHLKSVVTKVPSHWGIICICAQSVTIERAAKTNKGVSRRHQLSSLWKIELKNILVQNNMPMYALKGRGYIADRIVEKVPSSKLLMQIVAELKGRDYSLLQDGDEECSVELLDMISEQEFSFFTLDKWIKLYERAKRVCEKKDSVFEKEHNVRKPHVVPYTQIEVSLGVPWVSVDIVRDFIWELLDFNSCRGWRREHLENNPNFVHYEPITGNWHIESKTYLGDVPLGTNEYGLKRYNALYIIDATLNLREIKLFDGSKYNEADTIAALEKQAVICKKFSEWIWLDEDRCWAVEQAYNDLFADVNQTKYDGSRLNLAGINKDIVIRPYQKDAIQKIISTNNTLLAFDVGAGKTYIMIASAMLMRQSGLSRKNMFVVPNNIVGQWEKMFTELYPTAKVLTVDPKSFAKQSRRKVLEQIKFGDYDGIIIAYSCFEMIPLSLGYITSTMQEKISSLNEAVSSLRHRSHWAYGEAPLEREKKYISSLLDSLKKSVAENVGISFDELDINTLFVDEAHNYKNIPIRTALKNLRGINVSGSDKCLDMLQKVRCVQRYNNGRGVVFATGTPLCNSVSDAYAMQTYLYYDELKRRNLDRFDNWVKTFARPEQVCEIDVDTSKFRFVRRFTKFFNLTELSKLFGEMTAFYANEESELPECADYSETVMKRSKQLADYMNELCKRTDDIRAKKVDKSKDNMLKVTIDGRKAALDLALVDRRQSYDETSKVYNCVKNVIEIFNKYEGCSQLVFCDYSTPKGDDFSVYAQLKERLIESGIPSEEIAFVHSCKSEESRLKLYDKVNSGIIRVLIGSTFKLGIGANVQNKLKAIHHLDVPWRPADMVQREGRILRRGNKNKQVYIYRYITEGSFDAYSWQILETKQRFISQFLNGAAHTRTSSDLENNVLSYGEVKALALSDPRMKELAEKENELRGVRILAMRENEHKTELQRELNDLTEQLPILQQRVIRSEQNAQYVKTLDVSTEYLREMCQSIPQELSHIKPSAFLFEVYGFSFSTPLNQSDKKPFLIAERNGVKYYVEVGASLSGNATRIKNFLVKIAAYTQNLQNEYEEAIRKINDNKIFLQQPSEYVDRITKLERERDEILSQIRRDDDA